MIPVPFLAPWNSTVLRVSLIYFLTPLVDLSVIVLLNSHLTLLMSLLDIVLSISQMVTQSSYGR
jgi:hypothetical protein